MATVMFLATFIALYSTTKVSESMGVILNKQLPSMMQTLRVAKAVDGLAATGVLWASVRTDDDRKLSSERFDNAVVELEKSLRGLDTIPEEMDVVQRLAADLTENLLKLYNIAEQWIDMGLERQIRREGLFSNLQTFKQHLTYRVRIIEGDNDVIGQLLSRSSPPIDQIMAMVRKSADWAPVQRFYTEVETITGRVLAAIQDPTLTALAISRQILKTELNDAAITFQKLPSDINSNLGRSFTELQDIVLSESGLLAIRKRELLLEIESQNLISENRRITFLVDEATSVLVHRELSVMSSAGKSADELRQKYTFILLIATVLGLLGIGALMYFHVIRHVILRLSWLSEAMQSVAAGKLEGPLPPAGRDELGRLGFAVRQFQKTAVEASQREADLRLSNQKVEKICVELEQNAEELEKVNNKLGELSVTDFLTGVANRRHFDGLLGIEWARAMRTSQPLTAIMIDVDFFKNYNDKYGHQAGDECLKKVASALKANLCRAGDLVARYGGEEFSIISAGTDLAGARALGEKLRRAVYAISMMHEDSPFNIVTVSIGLAVCIPDRKHTANELICIADKALYEAKANGRNQIADFGEDPKISSI